QFLQYLVIWKRVLLQASTRLLRVCFPITLCSAYQDHKPSKSCKDPCHLLQQMHRYIQFNNQQQFLDLQTRDLEISKLPPQYKKLHPTSFSLNNTHNKFHPDKNIPEPRTMMQSNPEFFQKQNLPVSIPINSSKYKWVNGEPIHWRYLQHNIF